MNAFPSPLRTSPRRASRLGTSLVVGLLAIGIFLLTPHDGHAQWQTNPQGLHVTGSNVGIGTDAPLTDLHIDIGYPGAHYPTETTRGNVGLFLEAANNAVEIGNAGTTNARRAWILARHHSPQSYGKYYSTLHLQPDVGNKSVYRGVAIGFSASETLPVGTHLAVNGVASAAEIVVEADGFPDYVFADDYALRSLDALQQYIDANRQLPGMPSEDAVVRDGQTLGTIQQVLVEKVEELTLYTIEQHERAERQDAVIERQDAIVERQNAVIERHEATIDQQQSDLASLKQRVARLEALLPSAE